MKNTRKKEIQIRNIFILLVISVIIVTTISLSKYKSTTASESVTRIALMANNTVFSIENTETGYPGYSKIYPIEITNKQDNKICEVSQKYTITIKTQEEENIPLNIELYEDAQCTRKYEDENEDGIYESEDFSFEERREETKKYYLKISWPQEKNSSYYSLEVNYLRIDFIINQVD